MKKRYFQKAVDIVRDGAIYTCVVFVIVSSIPMICGFAWLLAVRIENNATFNFPLNDCFMGVARVDLSLRITDAAGDPLRNAEVLIIEDSEKDGRRQRRRLEVNDDGTVTATNVPIIDCGDMYIEVRADGYILAQRHISNISDGQAVDLDIALEKVK